LKIFVIFFSVKLYNNMDDNFVTKMYCFGRSAMCAYSIMYYIHVIFGFTIPEIHCQYVFFFLFDFTYTILVTKLFECSVFIFLVSVLFWACVLHDTDTAANSNSTVVNTSVIAIQNCLSIKYAHNNAIRAIMTQYKYAHVYLFGIRHKYIVHALIIHENYLIYE